MSKLSSQELSDVVIQSLSLAVSLSERFEIMGKNGLLAHKAKQSLNTVIPHIEEYINKVITPKDEDEVEHMKQGATVISELTTRIETAMVVKNIMNISARKDILREIIEETTDVNELYSAILNSGILFY